MESCEKSYGNCHEKYLSGPGNRLSVWEAPHISQLSPQPWLCVYRGNGLQPVSQRQQVTILATWPRLSNGMQILWGRSVYCWTSNFPAIVAMPFPQKSGQLKW